MKDFTRKKYNELICALQEAGYRFQTVEQYASAPAEGKVAIMRHDVDLHPWNALLMAQEEAAKGVKATYYFRILPESNRRDVMKSIVRLGHELGYHYEDMSLLRGDVKMAYQSFQDNLRYFRHYYPVRTICMHGAPTSRYDGRDLWEEYDYRNLDIICEPYLDFDYSRLFYLTDTGRRWDGFRVSRRDKIPVFQDQWCKQGLVFHTTDQIIEAIHDGRLPEQVLFTTHPQRWNENMEWWWRERIEQALKNIVKFVLVLVKRK